MKPNIFSLLILITILSPVFVYSEENGTAIGKPCYNSDSTFDVIGDSRAALLSKNFETLIILRRRTLDEISTRN